MEPTTAPVPAAPTLTPAAELDAVRIRRAELRGTIDDLEQALVAPAGDRAVVWGEVVQACLTSLSDDFAAHIEVTEGPGGLHQTILAGDLRLTNAVRSLSDEHAGIAEEIAALVAGSAAPVAPADVPGLRADANRMLGHLVRHRQRGADLIYEAYQTDIGGGD